MEATFIICTLTISTFLLFIIFALVDLKNAIIQSLKQLKNDGK
jgi:hypothetical protein